MASLVGRPEELWPLPRAVDELADAARWAGAPGPIWLAGVWYPSLVLSLDAIAAVVGWAERAVGLALSDALGLGRPPLFVPVASGILVSRESAADTLAVALLWLLPALLVYRLNVGLAYVAAPGLPERDGHGRRRRTLRGVWRAGRGLGLQALGMWATLTALLALATAFLFGPLAVLVKAFAIEEPSALVLTLAVPVLLLLALYGVVLQVVNQLALHSLAHNRRGVLSALTHAWRLVRHDPMAATRATAVDVLLSVAVVATSVAVATMLGAIAGDDAPGWVAGYVLVALAGVVRAGFWARAYRALGGPLRTDRLPGLEPAPGVDPESGAEPASGGW